MESVKGILKSKTVWGVLIMVIGSILGWDTTTQTEITDNTMMIVGAVFDVIGAGLAIYGRVTAKTSIRGLVK